MVYLPQKLSIFSRFSNLFAYEYVKIDVNDVLEFFLCIIIIPNLWFLILYVCDLSPLSWLACSLSIFVYFSKKPGFRLIWPPASLFSASLISAFILNKSFLYFHLIYLFWFCLVFWAGNLFILFFCFFIATNYSLIIAINVFHNFGI